MIIKYKNIFANLFYTLFITYFSLLSVHIAEAQAVKNKNYSRVGISKKASIEKINKVYIGIDFYWIVNRFDHIGYIYSKTHNAIRNRNFEDFLKDVSVSFGWRINNRFAIEVGYTHLGNVKSLDNTAVHFNGVYLDGIVFAQIASFKYTSIETYFSVGYTMLHCSETTIFSHALKIGTGLQLKVYGPLALRVGVDYQYFGENNFSKQGFLTFKTGLNLYFNV